MSGFAVYIHTVHANTLARRLEFTFEARAGLEHQDAIAFLRRLLGQRTRCFAADLLIGVDLQHNFFRNPDLEIA